MENKEFCNGCIKHCPANGLQCKRERAYMDELEGGESMTIGNQREAREPSKRQCPRGGREAREQAAPMWKRDDLSQEEKLMALLQGCSHLISHRGEGKGGQRRVLSILAEREQMTQRELMELLDIRAGSASEILGKMETDGKIRRSKNTFDRRSVNVELTEEGRNALEQMGDKREERLNRLFEGLTQEEKTTLSGLLEKLLGNWEKQFRMEERYRHKGCKTPVERGNCRPRHDSHGPHYGEYEGCREYGEAEKQGFQEESEIDGGHCRYVEGSLGRGPEFRDGRFHRGEGKHKTHGPHGSGKH